MLVLSEEERLLKTAAHEFLSERAPISAMRRVRDDAVPEAFDRALWQEMAELGWTGLLIPEAFGGSGFSHRGLGQVLEEAGRTLLASPLQSCALIAPRALAMLGTPQQQSMWLPRLAEGKTLMALALDEQPRHAPQAIRTVAQRTNDGYRLRGDKCWVPDGYLADTLLVVATLDAPGISRTDDPPSGIFLVPSTSRGLSVERLSLVDSRNAARVHMNDVELPADSLLGDAPVSTATLDTLLDIARIGLAAEMLGSAREAFERTLRYLKLREQFGVVIGSFQALKHRAALMYCELELTASAVLAALDALDSAPTEVAALASLAKAKACELAELVSNEAVQMHGGIGMTDAEEIGFFLKRARVAQQLYGDEVFHRNRYATLMGF
jgi:alkylation response protein AidB-like acyl-CoA dehydrogenase